MVAAGVAVGVGGAATYASFTSTTSNSGNSVQAAATFGCSAPGDQTVTASADSWLDQAGPDSNLGSDSVLKVISKNGSSNTRAIVQFSLPATPSGCTVTLAKLRLYNKSPSNGRTINAIRNAASWTEGGVTWNNQPATTGTAVSVAAPNSAAWMEWTVTSQVDAMYSGSNFGFKVSDSAEDCGCGKEQQFESRESGGNLPELVVTFG